MTANWSDYLITKKKFLFWKCHIHRHRKVFKSGPAISSKSIVYNVKGIVGGGLEGVSPLHNMGFFKIVSPEMLSGDI